MAAVRQATASDKQRIAKKLISLLKKRYKGSVPKVDHPILETILYAICLENSSFDEANDAFGRLESNFFDLNEIRVSSITELTRVFSKLDQPEWRALRVRSILHYVFENRFEYDFESLRRKTLDLAGKQLAKIKELSPFVRCYTLQTSLGSHLVPVDEVTRKASVWLGFVAPNHSVVRASDSLKSAVRKADVPLFCYLLRRLATDPRLRKTFDALNQKPQKVVFDLFSSPERLSELFKSADARSRTAVKKKKAKASGSERPKTRKTPAAKTTTRKKTTAKKTVKKKASVKSRGTKKTKTKHKSASRR
ncbi:MAG: hypothetical protein IID46_07610 [Planctomycetes bacterium]|nr:hypothetical protein [Planctomycetota bacterium]